ncbi:MAG: polymer-forming cytoskeletal protein [Deltaproteobacteria bacterium]|nr:polymer-forming cytoskeletal protein [Deltaproteobacteria bacterium]
MKRLRYWAILLLLCSAAVLSACNQKSDATLAMGAPKDALHVEKPCILGDESVYVGGRTVVKGDIRSNGRIILEAGSTEQPTTVEGNVFARGHVVLSGGTQVDGDVLSNTAISLQESYVVNGELISPYIVPPSGSPIPGGDNPDILDWPISAYPVSAASDPVVYGGWMGNCGTVLSANQQYGSISVHQNCTLVLEPGVYSFSQFYLFSGAALEIQGNGMVEINVEGPVAFSPGTTISGVTAPENLQIYTNAWVRIDNDVDFIGTIIAPSNKVTVGSGTTAFNGCIHAKEVHFNPDGNVQQTSGYSEQGTLSRTPIVLSDTSATSWEDVESDPNYARIDRSKLTNNTVTISACSVHFPPCDSGIPNTPCDSGSGNPLCKDILPSCFDAADAGKVLDEYQAFYNLAQIVEQFNNAGMELKFELIHAAVPHRAVPYVDPAANGYGNIHVEFPEFANEIESDGTYKAIEGTAFALHWDDTSSTWVGSHGVGAVEYAMLVIGPTGYMDMTPAGLKDVQKAPGLGVLFHEIGHILGFEEQRYRRYPWSELLGPTGGIGLWDVAERQTGVITAYTDWWLNEAYEPRPAGTPSLPGSGNPAVVTNPWRMHDVLVHRDPAAWDKHAFDLEAFSHWNPRHLRWNSEAQSFVDCHTGKPPVFKMQFSEVGANATDDVWAQWVISDPAGTLLKKVSQQLNATAGADAIIGQDSLWAQWEWETPLFIANGTGTGLPGTTGRSVYVTVEAVVTDNAMTSLPTDQDDIQRMTVKLYPENTTELSCRPKALPNTPSIANAEKFGTSVSRLYNSRWVAVGAPDRTVNGVSNVGSVYVYEVDDPSIPNNMKQVTVLEPPAGEEQAFLRMGTSVATAQHGTTDLILAGAPGYNLSSGADTYNDIGAVFVYKFDGANWIYMGRLDVPAANRCSNASFGFSMTTSELDVAIGAPKKFRLAIGAPGVDMPGDENDPDYSSVFIYNISDEIDPANWLIFPGTPLQRPMEEHFGWSIDEFKKTLVVGAPGTGGPGKAYVHVYTDNPATPTFEAVSPNPIAVLEADGPTVPDSKISEGTVRFGDSDPDYPFPPFLLQKENGDRFGVSVSINEDIIAVGASRHGYDAMATNYVEKAGAAFLFRKIRNDKDNMYDDEWYWSAKLVPNDGDRYAWDQFGASVHVGKHFRKGSRKTRTIAVAAPYHDYDAKGENYLNNAGAVFVFDLLQEGNLKSTSKIDATALAGATGRHESAYFGFDLELLQGEPWGGSDMKTDFWHELLVGAPGASQTGWFAWDATPNRGTASVNAGAPQPDNLVDANLSTVWYYPGAPVTLEFDIGENKSVVGFTIIKGSGCGYDLVVSTRAEEETIWFEAYNQTVLDELEFFADPVLARHVRFEITGTAGSCVGISELKVNFRNNW